MGNKLSREIKPLPCPFCGGTAEVLPTDPEKTGDAWGLVSCQNPACPAHPVVDDGEDIADDRGSNEYKKLAILRWNKRWKAHE